MMDYQTDVKMSDIKEKVPNGLKGNAFAMEKEWGNRLYLLLGR